MFQKLYMASEAHMLSLMDDAAHDCQHIYRVLYLALDIARHEAEVNREVLAIACLLHDIGRQKQREDPSLCHAVEGGKMAYTFLTGLGADAEMAEHVRQCIVTHRFRAENPPHSIEAKILFDADKLDATGLLGIARTLLYGGEHNRPLYSVDEDGTVSDGTHTDIPSFFHEYHFKLEKVYGRFLTKRGGEIAAGRQTAAVRFYADLLQEARETHAMGRAALRDLSIFS